MRLHVGINALFLAERAGGIGRYARRLLGGLTELDDPPQITVFAGAALPPEVLAEPWADVVEWARLRVGPADALTLPAQLAALPLLARRHGVDVLHSPANVGPIVAPMPTVVTLHDLIWLHHPEDWESSRRARIGTRVLATLSARAATRVIADSTAARNDLIATLRLSPEQLDVVPLAADGPATEPTPEHELRMRLRLGEGPLVLSVAQKRRYKRLDALVRAVAALDDGSTQLVLAGPPGAHEPDLRELARSLEIDERVHFLDWVSEQDLEGLYLACTCFALPTLIEGFGLPVLEALQRGAPVACSNRSSLPEVAGDAALYFDPERQDEVTATLRRLLADADLRYRLAAAGPPRAARFSWRATAAATLASYERTLASGRR